MKQLKKKIVVIGGGFAGIQFVKQLDTQGFEVLLIDKINHHQFQPLFYQVATAQLEPSSISFPIRYVLKHKQNTQIRLAAVLSVNTANKMVHTTIGNFEYDYLVIAIGCTSNFFGASAIEKEAFTLKSTYDAIVLRNHILTSFESLLSAKAEEKEALLNLVIVGAGPTGIELAGAFADIKKHILPKDYPGIDFGAFAIYLIEDSSSVLSSLSKKAQHAAHTYLDKMGIILRLDTTVLSYTDQIVTLSKGESIRAHTLIWAAGVTRNIIAGLLPEQLAPGNRIKVNARNELLLEQNVYAIGDIAAMCSEINPKGHPQLAHVAIEQATNLAKNLVRLEKNEALKDYEYINRGAMATIGRHKAIVDLPLYKFKGYFAWLVWMLLHLMLILSVKNKLIIFINWAWAYLGKNTSLRLILKSDKKI